MTILKEIEAERRRQIEEEGWTVDHDDSHVDGEMAAAAGCYALESCGMNWKSRPETPPYVWPWRFEWWKPKDRRRNLLRAAALLVAEIERLDRIGATPSVMSEPAEPEQFSYLPFKQRDRRQKTVAAWCTAAFGVEQATSIPQRGVRLLEEAVEAYQAAGGYSTMAHLLVDYVFERPVGKLAQELGGVGVTLLALAEAAGLSADDEELREVARVRSKPVDEFTKRNADKNAAGFDATVKS